MRGNGQALKRAAAVLAAVGATLIGPAGAQDRTSAQVAQVTKGAQGPQGPADAQRRPDWAAQLVSGDPFARLRADDARPRRAEPGAGRVERYVVASDERAFLFENRGREARLKFMCADDDPRIDCTLDPEAAAEEIHIVRPITAPRGDVVFKDRRGRVYLRLASYGGATVYWPGDEQGRAASRSFADVPSLQLPFADLATAYRRAQQATAFVSAQVGAPVVFEINDPAVDAAAGASVLADAVARAAGGVARVASDATGARAVAGRLKEVRLIAADVPELSLDGSALEVRYNAADDIDGRPSSGAVAEFLESAL
ncbi:MAG: DUF4908 domain-containing protein [Pseudomonadota bacterium]